MKGKIMIALVVLALVFGLGLASCDNGAQPKIDNGPGSGKDNITLDGASILPTTPGIKYGFYAGKYFKVNTGKGKWSVDTSPPPKWEEHKGADGKPDNQGDYDEVTGADVVNGILLNQ